VSRRYPSAPVVAVGVLLLDRPDGDDGQDHVLLVQRGRPPQVGRWTVPGGKVELGESLEEAALRELAEETGLACTLGPVVEVLDRVLRDGEGKVEYHYVILDLLGVRPTGTLRAGSDSTDARWVPVAELARWDTTDGLEPVVRRAIELRDGAPGPHRATER
jgi:ADP-ribose pyrophosphatase YjhB (NUDIX family)